MHKNTIKKYIENTQKVSFITIYNPCDFSIGVDSEELDVTVRMKILYDVYIEIFSEKKDFYNLFIITKQKYYILINKAYIHKVSHCISHTEMEFHAITFDFVDDVILQYFDRMSKLDELLN